MDSVIKVEGLSHNYGKKQALDNVSFEIAKGRVFGLVGENGAGKTTLIKHILGSLCPDSGSISVFGEEPTKNPPAVRLSHLLHRLSSTRRGDVSPGLIEHGGALPFCARSGEDPGPFRQAALEQCRDRRLHFVHLGFDRGVFVVGIALG